MGQVTTTRPLCDFLYRDPNRIASLYAQVFGGHMVSAEIGASERDSTDTGIGISALLKGDYKSTAESNSSRRDVLHPHDTIVSDLLLRLRDRIRDDVASAPNASLVRVRGSLSFGDGVLVSQMLAAFGEHSKPEGKNAIEKKNHKMAMAFMSKAKFPSVVQISQVGCPPIIGQIKEAGLEDSITAFYFKHGQESLPDVEMVGIKEVSVPAIDGIPEQLISLTRSVANAFNKLIQGDGAIRVTPITIYRHIG